MLYIFVERYKWRRWYFYIFWGGKFRSETIIKTFKQLRKFSSKLTVKELSQFFDIVDPLKIQCCHHKETGQLIWKANRLIDFLYDDNIRYKWDDHVFFSKIILTIFSRYYFRKNTPSNMFQRVTGVDEHLIRVINRNSKYTECTRSYRKYLPVQSSNKITKQRCEIC